MLDVPTPDFEIPRCKTCRFCEIETSGQSGAWGQDVTIKHKCTIHNAVFSYKKSYAIVGHNWTCNKHQPK